MPTRDARVPTFTFHELTIWRTDLPHVEHAAMPPSNTRPNPLVADDNLFVSVYRPGAVCALDRNSGKLLWRRELSGLGGASTYLYNDILFAKSLHTLCALHPENGEVLWAICPYDTNHEPIYSSPTGYQDRIYIGDRKGFLHCLDAATGQTYWKFRTSPGWDCDVNSTAVISNLSMANC
jgi:outer membrane protein assembly factor BamB